MRYRMMILATALSESKLLKPSNALYRVVAGGSAADPISDVTTAPYIVTQNLSSATFLGVSHLSRGKMHYSGTVRVIPLVVRRIYDMNEVFYDLPPRLKSRTG